VRANAAVVRAVARWVGVAPSRVTIVSGAVGACGRGCGASIQLDPVHELLRPGTRENRDNALIRQGGPPDRGQVLEQLISRRGDVQDEVFVDREPPHLIFSPRSPAKPLAGLTHIYLPAR